MTCWLVRTRRCYENRATLAYLLDAPHPIVKTRRGCSGIENYKLRRFATSAGSAKSVFLSVMMTMSGIGLDYGCESYDEHEKQQQPDASADAFGAVVRVVGLTVRGSLARSLLLTGNTGAALGVHARCAQTLQYVHPQCRRDSDLSQREERRAQRCMQEGDPTGNDANTWRWRSRTHRKIKGSVRCPFTK
jgi:hypothetical protein